MGPLSHCRHLKVSEGGNWLLNRGQSKLGFNQSSPYPIASRKACDASKPSRFPQTCRNFYKSPLYATISGKGVADMFIFLTRLGRLLVGIPVVIAVTTIIGLGTFSAVPVASTKGGDPGTCTVAKGSVVNGQQRLLVTGSKLTPSSSFTAAQRGVQSVPVTTDATGSFSTGALVYLGAGRYTIAVDYYYWRNKSLVQATAATCSANL
jgi:hypothetical protein